MDISYHTIITVVKYIHTKDVLTLLSIQRGLRHDF